jgi:hypothetical protein
MNTFAIRRHRGITEKVGFEPDQVVAGGQAATGQIECPPTVEK